MRWHGQHAVLLEQARIDDPTILGELPCIIIDGKAEPDRLKVTMTRRLVESSLLTVVHSGWVRDELTMLYPKARIGHVRQPVRVLTASQLAKPNDAPVVFGIFGSLSDTRGSPWLSRRLLVSSGPFRTGPVSRLSAVPTIRQWNARCRGLVRAMGLAKVVEIETEAPLDVLEAAIAKCDVAICLRWPTAGEVSAVLMRALGAGKPVIVSDVPQYRDLDPLFCWRVPIEAADESTELERLMKTAIEDPELVRTAGAAAQRFIEAEATVPATAERYLELITECRPVTKRPSPTRTRGSRTSRSRVPPVNVIADWQATTGLAESARRSLGALVGAGVTVAVQDHPIPGTPHDGQRLPSWLPDLPTGRIHDIDICYLNVNELHVMTDEELRPEGRNNYLIGYWFWELPSLPKAFREQANRVDEIWVGSRFTQEALLGETDKPIHVMPCVVTKPASIDTTRKDLDLPGQACIFFLHFDAYSTFGRKNPWAVIRAFRRAFTPEERSGPVRLVLKTINLSRTPAAAGERLVREMRRGWWHPPRHGAVVKGDGVTYSPLGRVRLTASFRGFRPRHRRGDACGFASHCDCILWQSRFHDSSKQLPCRIRSHARDHSEIHFNPGMEFVYEKGQLGAEANIDHAARCDALSLREPRTKKAHWRSWCRHNSDEL